MANYYGYSTGGNSQSYGRVTSQSYGGSSYATPQSQQSSFIAQTHQVQQPQTAYVTYGHQSSGSSGSSQTYQTSYNNYSSSTPQQSSYSSNATQSQQYYQQPSGSTQSARNGSTSYYSGGQSHVKSELRPSQLYASSGSTSYNHLRDVKYTKPEVPIPASPRAQASNQPSYISSKPVSATVISTDSTSSKSTSDYSRQQNISNYEKALISAATSMYQQRKGGGGAANVAVKPAYEMRNLPYWKQKRLQAQANRDPNRPIVASEVKAYLYAWLTKEKSRPDYNITAHGSSKYRQTYVCEVVAAGFNFVAKGAASNKKDAQTRAAWDFVDFLVKEGRLKEEELPTRENKFKAGSNRLPASYKEKDQNKVTEDIAKKKVVTNNIKFVGGSTLQLSGDTPQATESTNAVAYPTVAVTPKVEGTTAVEKVTKTVTVAVAPSNTTVVRVQQNSNVDSPKALSANDVDVSASKNSPIGESYVEQVWTDGRVIRYHCKICECEFNDPSGRELHIRGRRHRLSYKKKVDPSIEVDVKLNPKQKSMMMAKMRQEARKEAMKQQQKERMIWKEKMKKAEEEEMMAYEEALWFEYQQDLVLYEEGVEYHRRHNLNSPAHLLPPQPPVLHYYKPRAQIRNQQLKTRADDHVTAKHAMIYPSQGELEAVQKAVQHVEGALKEVSGVIHEQELKVYTAALNSNFPSKKPPPQRLLKAVLRIGALAKGLLLRGNMAIQMVLMCNEKPTAGMLARVCDHLPKYLGKDTDLKFSMEMSVEECGITLATSSDPVINMQIILTATTMRPKEATADATKEEESSATKGEKPDPPDILDRQKCCHALAAIRHSKWFQAKANGLQSCVIITRILRDLRARVPTWGPLSDWAIELLVERSIASAKLPLSPSGGLERVLEAIASGVLLPQGLGLLDPCERDPTDAAAGLTAQQREDITASAQHALRLIAFRDIHKVLGIDKLPESQGKKRPVSEGDETDKNLPENEEVANLIKKVKKELGKDE